MSFEEKLTWVNATITMLVVAVYASLIGDQVGTMPVGEIAYQRPMIVAAIAMIVLTIIGAIVTAIGSAVGTAVRVQVTGEGSMDDLDHIDRSDERDKSIGRRGDLVGYYVSSALMFGVLVMTMVEVEHFWIANAMFAAFVIAGLTSSVVKLYGYRRGF